MHKCETCRFKGEYQEPGFRPEGVCLMIGDLMRARIAYQAPECPFRQAKEDTWKDKLVKLLKRTEYQFTVSHSLTVENVAEDLLKHGVMIQEMKKPITLEEVDALEPDRAVYMEFNQAETDALARMWGEEAKCFFQGYYNRHEYGKEFRCWLDRKPTEEERKAAEWEK